LVRVELEVAVVVPFLECESEALIMEEFRIKLVVGCGWGKGDLIVMDTR
jgi:hypothetical protein